MKDKLVSTCFVLNVNNIKYLLDYKTLDLIVTVPPVFKYPWSLYFKPNTSYIGVNYHVKYNKAVPMFDYLKYTTGTPSRYPKQITMYMFNLNGKLLHMYCNNITSRIDLNGEEVCEVDNSKPFSSHKYTMLRDEYYLFDVNKLYDTFADIVKESREVYNEDFIDKLLDKKYSHMEGILKENIIFEW